MAAVACELSGSSAWANDARSTPFAQAFVTLTKQAHIELVMQASYWRSAHRRALDRLDWQAGQYRELLGQALQREAALHSELPTAQAKVRDLQQRVFGRKTRARSNHRHPAAPGRAIAPLFEPLERALVTRLRSEQHWHADETRWQVGLDRGRAGSPNAYRAYAIGAGNSLRLHEIDTRAVTDTLAIDAPAPGNHRAAAKTLVADNVL